LSGEQAVQIFPRSRMLIAPYAQRRGRLATPCCLVRQHLGPMTSSRQLRLQARRHLRRLVAAPFRSLHPAAGLAEPTLEPTQVGTERGRLAAQSVQRLVGLADGLLSEIRGPTVSVF